jgi:hypothetical protein
MAGILPTLFEAPDCLGALPLNPDESYNGARDRQRYDANHHPA